MGRKGQKEGVRALELPFRAMLFVYCANLPDPTRRLWRGPLTALSSRQQVNRVENAADIGLNTHESHPLLVPPQLLSSTCSPLSLSSTKIYARNVWPRPRKGSLTKGARTVREVVYVAFAKLIVEFQVGPRRTVALSGETYILYPQWKRMLILIPDSMRADWKLHKRVW
jgi:hypothetical protein